MRSMRAWDEKLQTSNSKLQRNSKIHRSAAVPGRSDVRLGEGLAAIGRGRKSGSRCGRGRPHSELSECLLKFVLTVARRFRRTRRLVPNAGRMKQPAGPRKRTKVAW